jgi:hypothetical protein
VSDPPLDLNQRLRDQAWGAVMAAPTPEAALQALAAYNAIPREPGRYKVNFAGLPQSYTWEGVCPDCGRHLGPYEGVAFGDFDQDSLHIAAHRAEDCPCWRNRLWRLWYHHTWGKVSQRWESWTWRRRARKERRRAGLPP